MAGSPHEQPEIQNLLGIVERDLKDSRAEGLSNDWRFAIAYNAALQAAVAALTTAGYPASRESHHYRVIQSLELTVVKDAKFIRSFDAFRKKRNVSNYDIDGGISDREVQEMIAIAESLREDVEHWIRTNHARLLGKSLGATIEKRFQSRGGTRSSEEKSSM
jgi:uncharacterized protein (UPF0332 family)